MTKQNALYNYLLRLGDNALIHGHRLSEWCSKGPILEEDLALTNLALDNIGRAQAFLKYAAEVEGKGKTEDDLAYKRGEREFLNNLITELPIGDFAFTIAKQLFIAAFDFYLFTELANSTDQTIAGISAKALKEARYHLVHAQDWCYRLGKGTTISHDKLQNAVNELWMFTDELFEMNEVDALLVDEGIAIDLTDLKVKWMELISPILQDSTIIQPNAGYKQTGSRKGVHTEYLGHLLAETQYLQRAYPDATW